MRVLIFFTSGTFLREWAMIDRASPIKIVAIFITRFISYEWLPTQVTTSDYFTCNDNYRLHTSWRIWSFQQKLLMIAVRCRDTAYETKRGGKWSRQGIIKFFSCVDQQADECLRVARAQARPCFIISCVMNYINISCALHE